MIAVQLPDGAALGRTVNSLNETTKIALATPGVKQVITIAGISVLDNSATLANAGVNYVIFDDWKKREKAKGQDLVSAPHGLQKKIESISDGRAFVAGTAADPGNRQCRRLPDAGPAARRQLQLYEAR